MFNLKVLSWHITLDLSRQHPPRDFPGRLPALQHLIMAWNHFQNVTTHGTTSSEASPYFSTVHLPLISLDKYYSFSLHPPDYLRLCGLGEQGVAPVLGAHKPEGRAPQKPPPQSLFRAVFLVKRLGLHGTSPGSHIQESSLTTICSLAPSGNMESESVSFSVVSDSLRPHEL